MVILKLNKGKEKSILRRHLWIFSGAIYTKTDQLENGEIVKLTSFENDFLAIGYFQRGSIAVRILSFEDIVIDQKFWDNSLSNALNLRTNLNLFRNESSNCFRLFHAEGDYIPGLVIDYYNGVAVIQCHTMGIYNQLEFIKQALINVLEDNLKGIFNKSEQTLKGIEGIKNEWIHNQFHIHQIKENNINFEINFDNSQKTGFFLDQRDNRKALSQLSNNKTVLNLFSYTGGFSCYALKGNAKEVTSIDISEEAIKYANRNVNINFDNDAKHNAICDDIFKYLKNNDKQYDIVVCDPPAFAKHIGALKNAKEAYKRLNTKVLEMVKPGGFLFTFSCSQVITNDIFKSIIFSAGLLSNKNIRIIKTLSQGADHPINMYHPEVEYLKGYIIFVGQNNAAI